jgi:hypothetical protein
LMCWESMVMSLKNHPDNRRGSIPAANMHQTHLYTQVWMSTNTHQTHLHTQIWMSTAWECETCYCVWYILLG